MQGVLVLISFYYGANHPFLPLAKRQVTYDVAVEHDLVERHIVSLHACS